MAAMLAFALVLALSAVAAALVLRRRRGRRSPPLSPAIDPLPAGMKHLAKTVSDLSDLGLHLPSARATAVAGKARLGTLLDLRQH
jgi:hypothetical protein